VVVSMVLVLFQYDNTKNMEKAAYCMFDTAPRGISRRMRHPSDTCKCSSQNEDKTEVQCTRKKIHGYDLMIADIVSPMYEDGSDRDVRG